MGTVRVARRRTPTCAQPTPPPYSRRRRGLSRSSPGRCTRRDEARLPLRFLPPRAVRGKHPRRGRGLRPLPARQRRLRRGHRRAGRSHRPNLGRQRRRPSRPRLRATDPDGDRSLPAGRRRLAWTRRIKQRLGCTILAGGVNCSVYPRETLEHPENDNIVVGHAHRSLPKLLDALDGGGSIEAIEGVGWKVDGELAINAPRGQPCLNLDAFARPRARNSVSS